MMIETFNVQGESAAVDKAPTLEELVSQITPENRHEETNWGPDRGKEIIAECELTIWM